MDQSRHWENVYRTKPHEELSWYEPHLATSYGWITEAAVSRQTSIIDVGGGASTLVDDLHADGFCRLTVLDLSAAAIARSQDRLGVAAEEIQWIIGDVTNFRLPEASFDIWHDRAVFHFLTDQSVRDAYINNVSRSVKPSGQVILATFSLNGPSACSGLPVCRYDSASLSQQFGAGFELVKSTTTLHHTPAGATQEFLYCQMVRR